MNENSVITDQGMRLLTACPSCGDIEGHSPTCYFASRWNLDMANAQVHQVNTRTGEYAGTIDVKPVETDEFYLQDSRNYIGNDMLFWGKNGAGYTTDVSKAHVYTRKEAQAQHDCRETDIPWPKAYIDARVRPAVDVQHVKRDDALKDSGITINKPRKVKKTRDIINCSKCGSFTRLCSNCKRCGTANWP